MRGLIGAAHKIIASLLRPLFVKFCEEWFREFSTCPKVEINNMAGHK